MHLDYPQKKNGMFILSKRNFDEIATQVLHEYLPASLANPRPLDIDYLIQECLCLLIKNHYLSYNGSILGMITFDQTEWPAIGGSKEGTIILEEGTIVVDPRLNNPEQRTRYRFTKAHEASHWMLHRSYHSPNNKVYDFRKARSSIACRDSTIERYHWQRSLAWADTDWEEWQADSLAAAILMPQEMFRDAFETAMRHNGLHQRYLMEGEKIFESRNVIREIAAIFDVSQRAAQIRMCHFGMIRHNRFSA